MKIAIAFSGLSRLSESTVSKWKSIIQQYNADVYIHSWIAPERMPDVDQLKSEFNPRRIQVDSLPNIDVSLYPDRHWPCIDVYRSLSMWESINRSHQLVLTSSIDYDIVIRTRFDFYVENLEIDLFDGITIPYDPDKFPLKFTYNNSEIHGVNDHFAYSALKWMDMYVNTLNTIPSLYKEEGVDYCPENFLAASLIKQNVPVRFQHMNHKLIRG